MADIKSFVKRHKKWLIIGVIVVLALWWAVGKLSDTDRKQIAQATPVTVEKSQQHSVSIDLQVVGNANPYATVEIKSQVEGPITQVAFREGENVKAGDILFVIDKRPFEVALQEAEANLAREKALLTDAEIGVTRIKGLLSKKFASQESYDQAYTEMLAQQASVDAAEAALDNANLQLDYCTIRSPIDGRTGNVLVHLGNLVKANDTQVLVVVNQLHPIYVTFDVPEKYLPAINRRLQAGKVWITANDVNGHPLSAQGDLFFVDNTIDNLTGTVQLKANFDNENQELWPGQFINIKLGLYEVNDAITISTRAIQQGQKGSYVYVINKDNEAEYRSIQLGDAVGDTTIITQGLGPDEQVVVNGQFRLVDGAPVTTTVESAIPSDQAPADKNP